MSVNFSNFTSGTAPADTDQVVGYVSASSGGERRWTIANLRNSLITGAATTIDKENLTVSRALVSDASGKVGVSAVTSTELGYLDGVTRNVQTQLNEKGTGNGTVTSVTGTAPISVSSGTTTPAISIAAATTSSAGSMSSTDKFRLDDAASVNGILKCNGSGNFSVAVAGTDYPTTVQGARAWVNFNGSTGAIRSDYNVSSITKTSTGIYQINFSTPMNNADYACVVGAGLNGGSCSTSFASSNYTRNSVKVHTQRSDTDCGDYVDTPFTSVIIFEK